METVSGNLKKKSDDRLADWQSQFHPNSDTYILAEKEWQRRERLEQHELDLKILREQTKWMKFSAALGVVAVIVGAILGAYLQSKLS